MKIFSWNPKKYSLAPETPGEIEVKDIGSRSAILDWQREHRGHLDGFYLETTPPDGDISRPKKDTDKQREVTGLKPGKRYSVKVHSTAYGLLRFCVKIRFIFKTSFINYESAQLSKLWVRIIRNQFGFIYT